MSTTNTVTGPGGLKIPVVEKSQTGFNAMGPEDFLKLMIAQLQNQDPTNPTSNEDLLGQISQMRNLQASIKLEELLETLAISQNTAATASFASSAAGLIGHHVSGQGPDEIFEGVSVPGKPVEGVVDRAVLRGGKAYVGIGDKEIPLENIQQVTK